MTKTTLAPQPPLKRMKTPKARPPVIPLVEHRLIPALIRELEKWKEKVSDPTFLERIVALMENDQHVATRVREILNRVKFEGAISDDFDSRKFFHLSNLLLSEIVAVEADEPLRRSVMDIDDAMEWITANWMERRLSLMI